MLKLLCLCIIWVVPVSSNLEIALFNQSLENEDGELDVTTCIRNILTEISDHNRFIMDIILMNIKDEIEIHKLHGIKKARFVTRSFSWVQSKLFYRLYVIQSDDFNEFKTGMEETMNDAYFNTFANFIIVIDEFKQIKTNITKFLVFHNIYNVTILTKDNDGEGGYVIYTFHAPIRPCNRREALVKISHCSHYTGGSYIFPNIEAIGGCRFKIIAHNFFPMVNFDDQNDGTEQRVIKLFEAYAGVKIEVIQYTKMDKLGRLVPNFTYVDTLEKVQKNEYDGAIGGYYISIDTMKKLSFVYPLTIDYVVAVMRRSDFLDTWHAFSCKGDIGIILIFVLIGLFSGLAHFLSLFPSQRTDPARSLLIVIGLFLNRSFLRKFKRGIAENFLVCSLLFSIFLIPFTLQAFMSSVKTHPLREYEPKDLDEIVKNYRLIGPNDWPREGIVKSREDCESRLDCLKQLSDGKDKKYFTYMAIHLYDAYKWTFADENCNLQLYRGNEPVSTLMRTMYLQRGSVLIHPFNKFYFRAMSSGIITHHYHRLVFKERLKCKIHSHSSTLATSLKDLRMSYSLLIGGICLSLVIFACEISTRK